MDLFITVEGQPIKKNRPRFARRGKFVQTYSDQETEESLWILSALEQVKKWRKTGQDVFFSGPVEVEISCFIKRPKNHYGTGRNKAELKASAPRYPESGGDIDNYEKFALDCLNHCGVWRDDACVVGMKSKKRYALGTQEPRTEILIKAAE